LRRIGHRQGTEKNKARTLTVADFASRRLLRQETHPKY
jgi:hypothetical protein